MGDVVIVGVGVFSGCVQQLVLFGSAWQASVRAGWEQYLLSSLASIHTRLPEHCSSVLQGVAPHDRGSGVGVGVGSGEK